MDSPAETKKALLRRCFKPSGLQLRKFQRFKTAAPYSWTTTGTCEFGRALNARVMFLDQVKNQIFRHKNEKKRNRDRDPSIVEQLVCEREGHPQTPASSATHPGDETIIPQVALARTSCRVLSVAHRLNVHDVFCRAYPS